MPPSISFFIFNYRCVIITHLDIRVKGRTSEGRDTKREASCVTVENEG
jgi:hypothetical protein